MIFLNAQRIDEALRKRGFEKNIHYHLYASIDSTNRLLKTIATSNALDICCAEMQTAGRGRFGREWFSPFGENIYFSSRWHFNGDLSSLSGLSLVVSLSVLTVLNAIGIKEHLRVKWPNDLLWLNKKLSGNLIEIIAESNGGADVVIGIGLNVNSLSDAEESDKKPTIPWCSLQDITHTYHDRNALIAALIHQLDDDLTRFMVAGFQPFISSWNAVDYLKNQFVTVFHPTTPLHGKAMGVDLKGQLILLDDHRVTHYLSSGDTSLRT
jgi:BirA family biotin operon repressor/biotin-[acetyl-CoA-carboxylase] ligase